MSYEKNTKQTEIMELLHEELTCSAEQLEYDATFTLEHALDNAIIQMQMNFLEGRI